MIGIYKITNPFNQSYIGQSMDIEKRFEQHKLSISSNYHLSLSFKKHGIDNHLFEVIEECDLKELFEKERHYLSFYKKKNILFNYSICLFYKDSFEFIENPDFALKELEKVWNKIEIKKQKRLNRKVSLTIKLNKIMKDEIGQLQCKEIAENAVNAEYRKRLKNKER